MVQEKKAKVGKGPQSGMLLLLLLIFGGGGGGAGQHARLAYKQELLKTGILKYSVFSIPKR